MKEEKMEYKSYKLKENEVFIVKVQLPLYSSEPVLRALVYDQTRKRFNDMMDIDENITRAMKGRPKAFFRAALKDETFYLATESEVPDPGW